MQPIVNDEAEAAEAGTDYAIQINSVWKKYRDNHVLNGLTLQVPMGKIYGLLGPSGCGKTTLLKCVVGRVRPDSGLIRVLGQRPGKLGHRVPGNLIGYMPQDLALYQDFTIMEVLFYFGRIFRMPTESIVSEMNFLTALLKLPDKEKLICQLSGGQQRRVSFACALLHKPPLLILDEPTVGVDPMLRQCIWYYLQAIVSNTERPTTVVITTHYIEEARQGHLVALMRDGRLLAEANPDSLLALHGEPSLESVFLKLCRQNSFEAPSAVASKAKNTVVDGSTDQQAAAEAARSSPELSPVEYREAVFWAESTRACLAPPDPGRVLAVMYKNATNLRRRIPFLLFQVSLPVVQIVLFCVCIGGDPFGLPLAVVNLDSGLGGTQLGVKFLNHLDAKIFAKTSFPDVPTARSEVRRGRAWGVLHLARNFTASLLQRMQSPQLMTNASLVASSANLEMDNSNYQVSVVLRQGVSNAFQAFLASELAGLGLDPALSSPPLCLHPPLLGSEDASFTEFMAPGMIVTILFFMATGLTALSFVLERKEGLLERSLVAGVSIAELMLGHILTELVIMAGQTGALLLFCLVVFRVRCHGSVLLVIAQALASGFSGMCLGLLISAVCTTETSAIQASLGTMYPSLLLSGIIWPIEGMPVFLRRVSSFLPCTLAVDAMRSVMGRGFGITAQSVWLGLISSLAWSAGLLILALILLKVRGI